MGSAKFHEEKIREVLQALEKSKDSLFLLCVSLFYLGVHLIDLHLAIHGHERITNHGDRKNKLRKLDGNLFEVWNSLLSISNDQRYNDLTRTEHLQRLLEDIKSILSEVKVPESLEEAISKALSSLPYP